MAKSIIHTKAHRSIIKTAGGKCKQASYIVSLVPEDIGTYFEPFLGGGTVFLNVTPENAVLSDRNPRLINMFRAVKLDHEQVADLLDALVKDYLGKSYEDKGKMYYEQRDNMNQKREFAEPDFEQAARYILLNKISFNGLYRENKKGNYNTPWGKDTCKPVCDRERLAAVSQALQSATIINSSFAAALATAKKGDFAFIDAVYDAADSKAFTGYTRDGFTAKHLEALRDICDDLTRRGVLWLMTNSSTPTVKALFAHYHIREEKVARSIAAKGSARGKATDVIISNYVLPTAK